MDFSRFSLKDKIIVVTGASSGIGRQCAITFSQMGAIVAIFGRDQDRLMETLDSMSSKEKHHTCAVDLLDYDNVEKAVKEVVNRMGRISGLVNCAGISTTLPFKALSIKKMEHFLKTNVIGGINLTKQVVTSSNFSVSGGSVIFISSVMGVTGENGKTLYSMTKGSLIAAAKSLAIELAPRDIRVNCISPAVVESPMSKNAIYSKDEESLDRVRKLHPLGLGKPVDIANASVFLLSDASGWITGTNMIVDGGYLAR